MSRWFRHYAGMMRDDKLVRAALKAKQSIERTVWIWGAVLESAAETDDEGRYEVDPAEIAHFLRCKPAHVDAILEALKELGRIDGECVTAWSKRQFKSDRSKDRVTEYRARKRAERNGDVTLQERRCNAPETETETESIPLSNDNGSKPNFSQPLPPDPDKLFWDSAKAYLGASKASLIGKWASKHGKPAVIAAIAAAQAERAIDPISFIEGIFRKAGKQQAAVTDPEMPEHC